MIKIIISLQYNKFTKITISQYNKYCVVSLPSVFSPPLAGHHSLPPWRFLSSPRSIKPWLCPWSLAPTPATSRLPLSRSLACRTVHARPPFAGAPPVPARRPPFAAPSPSSLAGPSAFPAEPPCPAPCSTDHSPSSSSFPARD
jgi:hypothetical protein